MKHFLDLRAAQFLLVLGFLACASSLASAAESLWLEAEHFVGLKGYCWPMGPPAIKKTAGHFGLSGPSVLDISRYYLDAKATDPGTTLVINWSPGQTFESLEARMLREPHAPVGRVLRTLVPERLAVALALHSGVELSTSCLQIPRENRRVLVRNITEMSLPITGDRGYTYAEVTAGGVPLDEIHLATMASRVCLGLHLCGEICDVDGRIGGFNFQWAWSSGYAAGVSV